jgi:hypothetical protein
LFFLMILEAKRICYFKKSIIFALLLYYGGYSSVG